ncbi:MAG: LytR C-terminal domain-containing protein [Deltaproteobacteria bacterium]|nr:LytR C-terminal domain-containing protein [Deltaproteobacteria bacterium]
MFSGSSLQRLLLIILPVAALSFYILGSLRNEPVPDKTRLTARNRLSRPITSIPGKIEVKTSQPVDMPRAEEKSVATGTVTRPEQSQKALVEATGPTTTVKSEAPAPPPTTTIVTTSQATTSEPTTTAPTTTLAPAAAAEKTLGKFKVPPPKWQTLDENWDEIVTRNTPDVDESNLSKAAWQQLDLGQSEKIEVGSQGKSPTIAETRAQSQKTVEEKKPAPKIKEAPPVKKVVKTSVKKKKKEPSGPPRLAILNESGQSSVGETYRYVLTAMGFPVNLVEDKPKRSGMTVVYHRPDLRKEAQRLLDHLPGPNRIAPMTWKSQFDLVILIR